MADPCVEIRRQSPLDPIGSPQDPRRFDRPGLSEPCSIAQVAIGHLAHTAKISLRGEPSDNGFLAAVGRTLDMVLPCDPLTSVSTTGPYGMVVAMNLGPNEWLISGEPGRESDLVADLTSALDGVHAAVVDITENSTILRLSGDRARDTLAKGMPLDIDGRVFPTGSVAQTLLGKADVILHRRNDDGGGKPVFDIHVRRSFAEYLWSWLLDAGQEYSIGHDETCAETAGSH